MHARYFPGARRHGHDPGDRSRAIRADPHRSAGCDGVRAAPQADPRRSRPIRAAESGGARGFQQLALSPASGCLARPLSRTRSPPPSTPLRVCPLKQQRPPGPRRQRCASGLVTHRASLASAGSLLLVCELARSASVERVPCRRRH